MYMIFKFIKKFIKALVADNRPWQIGCGVFLGCLLGFLPLLSWQFGIAWPAALALLIALVINVHLGSVLLFFGLSKLLYFALMPVAESLGHSLDGFAQTAAGIPLLHAAGLSHTGWLGMTLIGVAVALIFSLAMWRFTVWFRAVILPKLVARRKLVVAGKVAGNGFLVRGVCWFLGV